MPVIRRQEPKNTAPAAEANDFKRWLEKRARKMIRRQMFALELSQGLVTEEELENYAIPDTALVEEALNRTESEIEYYKAMIPGFEVKLTQAVSDQQLDFDLFLVDEDAQQSLQDFQDYEIVFFKNRTTAFTLEKPCPNCGKKELIAEALVFTRSADEAQDQFASCKNCSSRYKLRSVL